MSVIKTTYNITSNQWTQSAVLLPNPYVELQFNVVDAKNTELNSLNFGYVFSLDEVTLQESRFPTAGIIETLKSTSIINERTIVDLNKTYKLYVWAENEGNRAEKTFEIKTPIPVQPFASWSWNSNEWVPPVPMPEIGPPDENGAFDAYVWSEKQQKWFLMTPPLTQYDDI
jgi:hypothetical protein